jgi:hypothetical protein
MRGSQMLYLVLLALTSAVLGAGAPNPRITATFVNITSTDGTFFGLDMGARYPEFKVSALRMYTKVGELFSQKPGDAAVVFADEAFRNYEKMLDEHYAIEDWVAGIKTVRGWDTEKAEREGETYLEKLQENVTKRNPTAEERCALHKLAMKLYEKLKEGCDNPASKINGDAITFLLWDLQLGMKYKIGKE